MYQDPYAPNTPAPPTVCWRLFNEIFAVRIQNKFLWNEGLTKRVIGYHFEDEEANKELLNNYTTVYRTPIAMVMLYDKGVDLIIDQRSDMLIIYNLITQHLQNWADIIANPIAGRTPPPAEDFLILENFSMLLYEDAAFEQLTEDAKGRVNQTNHIDQLLAPFGHRRRKQKMLALTPPDPNQKPLDLQNASTVMKSAWDMSPWGIIAEHGNT